MIEEKWNIPSKDGKTIYGVTAKEEGRTNKKALVLLHGLTGRMYDHILCMTAKVFPDVGYDVIRFDHYGLKDKQRDFRKVTFQDHVDDTNAVLEHFSKTYDKLFVCGHSYGGPVALAVDQDRITALSLWDPGYNVARIANEIQHELDGFNVVWGKNVIAEPLMNDIKTQDVDWSKKLAKSCKTPMQVLYAEDGMFINDKDGFEKYAGGKTDKAVIAGTEHCFYEGESAQLLFEKLFEWIVQF